MAATHYSPSLLTNINWSFSTSSSSGRGGGRLFDCRKHHWFPATFIPEIPYTLIELLTRPRQSVLDPFGGIGTTFVQALLLGRTPYTIENSLVAVDFIRFLWSLFDSTTHFTTFYKELDRLKAGFDPRIDYEPRARKTAARIDLLKPWFRPDTFQQLLYLVAHQNVRHSPAFIAASRIALSAALKAASAQDEGWGCIADNMHPKPRQLRKHRDAIRRFTRNMTVLARDVLQARESLPQATKDLLAFGDPRSYIIHGDARKEAAQIPDGSIDLLVTSPPYPNMTDYATSQRLSYYLIGADPGVDLAKEIGARRKRFARSSVESYLSEMKIALAEICEKIRPGGWACFVMPSFETDHTNNSHRRQAVQSCLSVVLERGLVLEQELTRILPTRRRHHNQKWTSLQREMISVYRKVR